MENYFGMIDECVEKTLEMINRLINIHGNDAHLFPLAYGHFPAWRSLGYVNEILENMKWDEYGLQEQGLEFKWEDYDPDLWLEEFNNSLDKRMPEGWTIIGDEGDGTILRLANIKQMEEDEK